MCPDPSEVQFCIEIQRDVRIPTGVPGLTLSADVYRPRSTGPSRRW